MKYFLIGIKICNILSGLSGQKLLLAFEHFFTYSGKSSNNICIFRFIGLFKYLYEDVWSQCLQINCTTLIVSKSFKQQNSRAISDAICQAIVFESAFFHVHRVFTFVSCDQLLTVTPGFSFWLSCISQKKDFCTSAHLLDVFCTVLLSFFLSLSPCLSLWLSAKAFPRTTHLLLIWRKIQLAAGPGRYVLGKKQNSLWALIWCTHAIIKS